MSLSLQKELGLGFKPIEGFIKLAEEGVTSKRMNLSLSSLVIRKYSIASSCWKSVAKTTALSA
jgi:hypothetical protein